MSDLAVMPATVQVPADPGAPIVADFSVNALRVAFVLRVDKAALPKAWATPGVYVLIEGDRAPRVYVGRSTDLAARLGQHRRRPKLTGWWRAVAIRRDTSDGFHSAEIGYLEWRLARELGALPAVTLVEGQQDKDTTLPDHMLIALDALVPTMLAAVRMAGIDIRRAEDDTLAEDEEASPGRSYTPVPGTVADILAAGLLSPGTTVTAARGERSGTATIAADGDLVVDGVAYASPSRAACVALGVQSANGWTTWKLPDGSLLHDLRAELPAPANT